MLIRQCGGEVLRIDSVLGDASDRGHEISENVWENNFVGSTKDALKFELILSSLDMVCVLYTGFLRTVEILEAAADSENIDFICDLSADSIKEYVKVLDLLKDNVESFHFEDRNICIWKDSLLEIIDDIVELMQQLKLVRYLIRNYS